MFQESLEQAIKNILILILRYMLQSNFAESRLITKEGSFLDVTVTNEILILDWYIENQYFHCELKSHGCVGYSLKKLTKNFHITGWLFDEIVNHI